MGMKYGWQTDIQWFCGTIAFRYSGTTLSNGVRGMGYLFAVRFLRGLPGISWILSLSSAM